MATDTLPTEATITAAAPTRPAAPAAAPSLPIPHLLLGALFGGIILLAFAPLLQAHAENLWERPHYQFFPLALLGAALLAWLYGRTALASVAAGNSAVTVGGFAVSWVLLAVGEVFYSPALAVVSLLLLLASVIYGVGGTALFWRLLPAWALLWLLVPPPFGLDRLLVLTLQSLTSDWSSAVLDTLGVVHLQDGNVVQISGQRLLVEEACAGLSSLFSVLACGLFLIFWLRRPWLRALLLIVSAVGWVLVTNVLRIVTISYVFNRWGMDLSLGLKHSLLGFACFGLAVLLIWSTDRLFLFLFPRAAQGAAPANLPATSARAVEALGAAARLIAWPMAIAFGLLLAFHYTTYGGEWYATREPLPGLAKLDKDSLPETLADWKRDSFHVERRDMASEYGEHSKVWVFKQGSHTAIVALDYPFREAHNLNTCYANQGWSIEKLTQPAADTYDGAPASWSETRMKKAGLHAGCLFFCECTHGGNFVELEYNSVRSALRRSEKTLERWRQRLARPGEEDRLDERSPVYQLQLFTETNRPLTVDEEQSARRLFFAAVTALRKELYPSR